MLYRRKFDVAHMWTFEELANQVENDWDSLPKFFREGYELGDILLGKRRILFQVGVGRALLELSPGKCLVLMGNEVNVVTHSEFFKKYELETGARAGSDPFEEGATP